MPNDLAISHTFAASSADISCGLRPSSSATRCIFRMSRADTVFAMISLRFVELVHSRGSRIQKEGSSLLLLLPCGLRLLDPVRVLHERLQVLSTLGGEQTDGLSDHDLLDLVQADTVICTVV